MKNQLKNLQDDLAIAKIRHSLNIGKEATRHEIVDYLLTRENSNVGVPYTRDRSEQWAKKVGCKYSIRNGRGIFH